MYFEFQISIKEEILLSNIICFWTILLVLFVPFLCSYSYFENVCPLFKANLFFCVYKDFEINYDYSGENLKIINNFYLQYCLKKNWIKCIWRRYYIFSRESCQKNIQMLNLIFICRFDPKMLTWDWTVISCHCLNMLISSLKSRKKRDRTQNLSLSWHGRSIRLNGNMATLCLDKIFEKKIYVY